MKYRKNLRLQEGYQNALQDLTFIVILQRKALTTLQVELCSASRYTNEIQYLKLAGMLALLEHTILEGYNVFLKAQVQLLNSRYQTVSKTSRNRTNRERPKWTAYDFTFKTAVKRCV